MALMPVLQEEWVSLVSEPDGMPHYWERRSGRTTWERPAHTGILWSGSRRSTGEPYEYEHLPTGRLFEDLPSPGRGPLRAAQGQPAQLRPAQAAPQAEAPAAAGAATGRSKAAQWLSAAASGQEATGRAAARGAAPALAAGTVAVAEASGPGPAPQPGGGTELSWAHRVKLLIAEAKIGLHISFIASSWNSRWPDTAIDDYRPCKKMKDAVQKYVDDVIINPNSLLFHITRPPCEPLLGNPAKLEAARGQAQRMEALEKHGRARVNAAFDLVGWRDWRTSYEVLKLPEGGILYRCTMSCELPPLGGHEGVASASHSSPLARTWAYEFRGRRNEFVISEEEGRLVYTEAPNVLEEGASGELRPAGPNKQNWWEARVGPPPCLVRVRWAPYGDEATLEVCCKTPESTEWGPSMTAWPSTSRTYVGHGEGPHKAGISAMEEALKDPRLPPQQPTQAPAQRALEATVPEAPRAEQRALSKFEEQKALLKSLLQLVHRVRSALIDQAAITNVHEEDLQFREQFEKVVEGVCALARGVSQSGAAGAEGPPAGAWPPELPLTDPLWQEDKMLALLWQYALALGDRRLVRSLAEALGDGGGSRRSGHAGQHPAAVPCRAPTTARRRPEAGLPLGVWEELAERAARTAFTADRELADEALQLLDRGLTRESDRYSTHFLLLLFFERNQELRTSAKEASDALRHGGIHNTPVFRGTWARGERHRPDIDLQLLPGQPRVRQMLRKNDLALVFPYPLGAEEGVLVEVRSDFADFARVSEEAKALKLKLFAVALPWAPAVQRLHLSSEFVLQPLKSSRITHDRQVEAVKAVSGLSNHSRRMDEAIRELLLRSWQQERRPHEPALEAGDSEGAARARALAAGSPQDTGRAGSAAAGRGEGVSSSVPLMPAQREAVFGAATRRCMLIRGPPGTGKTHTACAIVDQWLQDGAGATTAAGVEHGKRVLVVTQSNTAALNIQERLQTFGLPCVRVGLQMRPEELLSQAYFLQVVEEEELQPLRAAAAAGADDAETRALIPRLLQRACKRAPVVVMTCISSGNMSLLGQCNFSRVLLDEAAQATEPTSLVPLMTGAAAFACVGDDRQLPATVVSRDAQAGGLGRSLFERLLDEGVVVPGNGFVQLDVQRRMHSSLIEFPSRHFYGSAIRDGVQDEERPPLPGLPWPREGQCRVLVVDVCPDAQRGGGFEEGSGTSIRNTEEASLLVRVLERVIGASEGAGDCLSVAAITGYSAQREGLRRLVQQSAGCRQGAEVRVDTADGFQGMERDLVLVSTVRSNALGEVGFLRDARRTNVMLTRARRGLVVFCDCGTLEYEKKVWQPWLRWAQDNGAIMSSHELRRLLQI